MATLNTAIDNMLLQVPLPRRSMRFKRMLQVSSLHTASEVRSSSVDLGLIHSFPA